MKQSILLGIIGTNNLIVLFILALTTIVVITIKVIKKQKSGTTQRPAAITILCMLIFLFGGVFGIIILDNFEEISATVGSSSLIANILSIIGGIVGGVGIWRMKKWGAYLYIGTQTVNVLINVIDKERLQMMMNYGYVPLIIQALCIGIVLFNFKKMTD